MVCYKDASGHIYDFGYGMNWKAVIKDSRTLKYVNISKPVISVKGNLVTIFSKSPGAKVYYTIDDSTPAFVENHLYSKPFTIKKGTTVKAIAKKYGINNSSMVVYNLR
jgi:beta-glucosidase